MRKAKKKPKTDETPASMNSEKPTKEEQATPEAEAEQTKDGQVEVGTDAETSEAEQAAEAEAEAPAEEQQESKDAELAQVKDAYLRLMAEFENFRRRSRQEKEQLYEQSIADVLTLWLPVLDNLARAQDAAEKLATEEARQILAGLELVDRQVNEALTKLKVERIDAVEVAFDPHAHEAVLHVEDEKYDEPTVVEVLNPGYRRGDKVIRHAVVKVAN